MEGSEIKKLMEMAGVTQVEIAKKVGVSKGCVNHVISGIRLNNRVRQAIAEAVGKSVEELWGDSRVEYERSDNDVLLGPSISKDCNSEELVVSPYCYYKFNKQVINRSIATFYKDLLLTETHRVEGVDLNGRRRRYFMKVDNPKEAENIRFNQYILSSFKKELVSFYIRVPESISRAVDSISSPISYHYDNFFNFLDVKNKPCFTLGLEFIEQKYVRKKMKILRNDYLKLSRIAKNNLLSIGKVLEIALKNFIAHNFRVNPLENLRDLGEFYNPKGGSYGNLSSAEASAEEKLQ